MRLARRPAVVGALLAASLYSAIALVLVVSPRIGCSGLVRTDPIADLRHDPVRRLSCFVQYDGIEYVGIARRGYWYLPQEQSPVVWFPVYPLAMRWTAGAFGGLSGAGAVLSYLGGLAATVLLWWWLRAKVPDRRARGLALACWLLYPYAFFLYGVIYADALCAAFLLGAFVLVERRCFVASGIVGALATATRPTAAAVIPAIVLLALERDGVIAAVEAGPGWRGRLRVPSVVDRGRLRPRTLAPAVSILGIGGYVTYLGVRFGAPLAFATNESTFRPGDVPLTKWAFVNTLSQPGAQPGIWLTLLAQAGIAIGVLLAIPHVARRFGFAYALFVALLLGVPALTSADLMGVGRYLLPAFPVAALGGEWLAERWPERRKAAIGTLVGGALGLVWLATFFARGSYLG